MELLGGEKNWLLKTDLELRQLSDEMAGSKKTYENSTFWEEN